MKNKIMFLVAACFALVCLMTTQACKDNVISSEGPDRSSGIKVYFGNILVHNNDVFTIEPNTTANFYDSTASTVDSTLWRFWDNGQVVKGRGASHNYPYVTGTQSAVSCANYRGGRVTDSIYFFMRMGPGVVSSWKGEPMVKVSTTPVSATGKYRQVVAFNPLWRDTTQSHSKWFYVTATNTTFKATPIDTNNKTTINNRTYYVVEKELWDTVATWYYGSWYDSTVTPNNWKFCSTDSSRWVVSPGGGMITVQVNGEWYRKNEATIIRPGIGGDSGPVWIHRFDGTNTTYKALFNQVYSKGSGFSPFVRLWYQNQWRDINTLPSGAVVNQGYIASSGFYQVELTKQFINDNFSDGYLYWQYGNSGIEAEYFGSTYYNYNTNLGYHLKEWVGFTDNGVISEVEKPAKKVNK